jgi:hypothetical protein
MDVEFKGIVDSLLDPSVNIPGGELEKFFVPILNPSKGDCGIDVRHLSNFCSNYQRDVKTLANEKGRTTFPHQCVEQIFQDFSMGRSQTGANFQRRTRSTPVRHAEFSGFREIKGVKKFCPVIHPKTSFLGQVCKTPVECSLLRMVSNFPGRK